MPFEKPPAEEPEKLEGNIEAEEEKLGKNFAELDENLEEVESSSPSRKEKIVTYLGENYFQTVGTLTGLGAGIASGNVEDFLLKTGLGTAVGYLLNRSIGKKMREDRKKEQKE